MNSTIETKTAKNENKRGTISSDKLAARSVPHNYTYVDASGVVLTRREVAEMLAGNYAIAR